MTIPENTTQHHPLTHLAAAQAEGTEAYITGMEAAGQRQLVNSDRLPVEVDYGNDADFAALGFGFGPPDPGDPLFRPVTLPTGWRREGSEHSMWSYLLDEHGRRRVAVFYKAAFYDRRAFMSMVSPSGYMFSVIHGTEKLVLDERWLTPAVAVEELTKHADRYEADAVQAEALGTDTWLERAARHREDRDHALKLRDRILAAA